VADRRFAATPWLLRQIRQTSCERRSAGLPDHFGRFQMPSQLNGVTAQQLADNLNYIRTSWGNDAPPSVTCDDLRHAGEDSTALIG
jgi:hypothetical protein